MDRDICVSLLWTSKHQCPCLFSSKIGKHWKFVANNIITFDFNYTYLFDYTFLWLRPPSYFLGFRIEVMNLSRASMFLGKFLYSPHHHLLELILIVFPNMSCFLSFQIWDRLRSFFCTNDKFNYGRRDIRAMINSATSWNWIGSVFTFQQYPNQIIQQW